MIFTTLTNKYSQFRSNIYTQFWQTIIHNFWPTHIHKLIKLRHLSVEVWSKFGRNFDQTSTLGVPKFGRSLVSKFGRHLIENLEFTMCFIHISSKLRPNFDTGGVEVWSKFLPKLYQTSTLVSKFGRSFYLRHRRIYTILSKPYPQSWSTNVHNLDPTIFKILTKQYSPFGCKMHTISINTYSQVDMKMCTSLIIKYSYFDQQTIRFEIWLTLKIVIRSKLWMISSILIIVDLYPDRL